MRLMLVAVVQLALIGTASAQETKPDLAEAKRAFKAGQELLQMDRFADAVVEFRKAYEITKDGLVMGQIAVAFEKAGDYEAALDAVKTYRDALPESDRGPAEELIKRYEKMISQGRSKKLALPTDAQPQPAVDPAAVQPKGDAQAGKGSGKVGKGRFWTWIAAGSAGALAVGALVVGLNAQSKYDDLETRCAPNCAASEVDSVRTRATVADVLWGLTAAAAVTAGVLFFLEQPRERGERPAEPAEPAEEEERDDEEEIARRIRFAPIFGSGGFGLGAELRY
jgi:tetratricopeptide (TPR) repeat protein